MHLLPWLLRSANTNGTAGRSGKGWRPTSSDCPAVQTRGGSSPDAEPVLRAYDAPAALPIGRPSSSGLGRHGARHLAKPLTQTVLSDEGLAAGSTYARAMRAFALAELGDRLALEVFLRSEDAFAALDDALADDPTGLEFLYVAPVELDERHASVN